MTGFEHEEHLSRRQAAERLVDIAYALTAGGTLDLTREHERVNVPVAKSVDGIRAVMDDLRVDPRDHWQDAEIRGTALQALVSRRDVPDDQLDVTVAGGWLTLKGQVKHQYDSDAAFDAVSGLAGVGGITNGIKVVTAGGH